jgi:hypothetical protein
MGNSAASPRYLQQRFGPEYTREVRARGTARDRYVQRWQAVQIQFVNRPGPAWDEADHLVTDVSHDRGYPVEDFSDRAEPVAADHPQVVEHYRAEHSAQHAHHDNSEACDTENLRQAFMHYRALFEELVQER